VGASEGGVHVLATLTLHVLTNQGFAVGLAFGEGWLEAGMAKEIREISARLSKMQLLIVVVATTPTKEALCGTC
jgi:hypothetical protein